MKLGHLLCMLTLGALPAEVATRALGTKPNDFIIAEREPLQDIVTWDEHSLFVHGERIIFWGGEVHPFRWVHDLVDQISTTDRWQASSSKSMARHIPED